MRFLAALFTSLFASFSFASECVINVGSTDYAPLTYSDNVGNVVGMDVELLEILGKRAGCEIRWLPIMNWERVERMLRTGEITVLTSASDTPERREYAKMIPYRPDSVRVFVRNENLIRVSQITSFDDFMSKTNYYIGTYNGYKYTSSFQKYASDKKFKYRFKPVPDNDISLQFKNLVSRKIDAVLLESIVGIDLIKNHGFKNKVYMLNFDLVSPGSEEFSNIMVSKAADPDGTIFSLLDNAVAIEKNSETYNDVINKYFNPDQ